MSLILTKTRQTNIFYNLLKNLLTNRSLYPVKFNTNPPSCCSKNDIFEAKKNSRTPHPPKDPPEDYNPLCIQHEALEVPDFIPPAVFRPFTSKCEKLGPGADKRGCYKNSEYFSYHRYSFVALQLASLKIREERMNVRCLYDYEESDDEKSSSDEDNK